MTEETLRTLVAKLGDLQHELEVSQLRLNDAEQVHGEVLQIIEKEAEKLGIDPYEVKEF